MPSCEMSSWPTMPATAIMARRPLLISLFCMASRPAASFGLRPSRYCNMLANQQHTISLIVQLMRSMRVGPTATFTKTVSAPPRAVKPLFVLST